MYRFKSIKYLSVTGFITALLFVVGYVSGVFFKMAIIALGGETTLQLFDALLIPFCAIFKGPMMLFAGPIAGAIFDLASGVRFVTIPATVLIRILMFVIIKLLTTKKWWSAFFSFLVAAIVLMLGYPLYYAIIYQGNKAFVIKELITDVVQASFAYSVALLLYYYLSRIQKKTNNGFWNDQQFDYLKPKQKRFKKIYVGEKDANC